jgi:membrane protein insertase Oxa1/YidC/SpoIIIJ
MFAALRRGIGAGIRFGWITDLARPDLPLAILASLFAAGGALLAPPAVANRSAWMMSAFLAGGMTLAFLVFNSSAMALSVAANGLVGIGQGWWLRREHRRRATS